MRVEIGIPQIHHHWQLGKVLPELYIACLGVYLILVIKGRALNKSLISSSSHEPNEWLEMFPIVLFCVMGGYIDIVTLICVGELLADLLRDLEHGHILVEPEKARDRIPVVIAHLLLHIGVSLLCQFNPDGGTDWDLNPVWVDEDAL